MFRINTYRKRSSSSSMLLNNVEFIIILVESFYPSFLLKYTTLPPPHIYTLHFSSVVKGFTLRYGDKT